jgi:hypothetical protein
MAVSMLGGGGGSMRVLRWEGSSMSAYIVLKISFQISCGLFIPNHFTVSPNASDKAK